MSSLGEKGEDFAVRLLKKNGYSIIYRHFRSRFGELDIVATKDSVTYFVEVKTRWSKKFGAPQEAVTARKLFRIKKTSEYFSLLHPQIPQKMLIQVVALEVDKGKVVSAKIITA